MSGTLTPATLVSGLGTGGVGYFVVAYTGVNDAINTMTGGAQVSTSTFKTNLQGMCSTIHGYGSNVKVLFLTPMQSTANSQSTESTGGYGGAIRSMLGTGTSGEDAMVDTGAAFTDPTDSTYFADGLHLAVEGCYYYSQMVYGTLVGVPYVPGLAKNSTFVTEMPLAVASPNQASNYQIGSFTQGGMPSSSYTYISVQKTNTANNLGANFGFYNTGTTTTNYALVGLYNGSSPEWLRVYGSGHATVGGLADDGVNMLNVNGSAQANAFNSNAAQTTVSGSTSGTIVGSEPMAGSSFKMVAVHLAGLSGTATYSFPVAFSNAPHEADALGLATTLTTGSATFTGSGTTADLMLIGY